jgi:exodeoxyribonuclease VII large subunit
MRFDDAKEALGTAMSDRIANTKHKVELLSKEIEAHSPLDVLRRGFAVVTRTATGEVLVSARRTSTGDSVDIRLYEGKLRAEVKESKNHENI